MMNEGESKSKLEAGQDVEPERAVADSEFTDEGFWGKLSDYALTAGKDVVELALKLYYALRDPETPDTAKAIIIGSLAYFVIPLDAVADLLPGGYVDDWGALMGALWTVSKHVKQEHADKAREQLKRWFGEEVENDKSKS